MDIQDMIFGFIGGLGIFLFGLKYMGDGLQVAAGDRLQSILDRFTTNPFMGVLSGLFITAIIQSSSGTTALTVTLVSAGFMSLRQAIGVIMGANIGTTVTAFLIGIDIGEYALPIIAAGTFILFFSNNKRKRMIAIGQVLFGFGALFFGLELMSEGMRPLRSLEQFQQLTITMSDNPFIGVMIGSIFTMIVQSSSATIGILQELYSQGALDLKAALPVLFGDNIGTTITAVLASIGTSISARRAALVHVLFNIFGTIAFLLILGLYSHLIVYLQSILHLAPEMTLAFAHGLFNLSNTIIQFPFIGVLAWAVTKMIPGKDSHVDTTVTLLNPLFIELAPSIALGQAREEINRMGCFAKDAIFEALYYLNTSEKKHAMSSLQLEEAIHRLDTTITNYLVEVSSQSLTAIESQEHYRLLDTIRDIRLVGDHIENIMELLERRKEKKIPLSKSAMKELNDMFHLTLNTFQHALQVHFTHNAELARTVVANERKIDKMEQDLRKGHIGRLNARVCTGDAGVLFIDIASHLERIGDHSANIAKAIIGDSVKLEYV